MKRIITSLIITVSALIGEAACNLLEPKFDSIEIQADEILTALKKLESEAQAIYAKYKMSPTLIAFDFTEGKKKKIEYTGKGVSCLEVASELLKMNGEEFYISDTETIWIGVTEKRIKNIESEYPFNIRDVIFPMVVFEDMSISEVEDILAKLWLIYNPQGESAEWRMNIGRTYAEKINLKCKQVDFLTLVTYLDIITSNASNQAEVATP
ncbi:hypothetical protein DDZ13_14925 [Coraliomargarita sinensis]|uniref:Uncharacterized protein n=1 Tax=Coraliomargarita sinensis TaxID=2174842 RepID=A0A317ZHL6_9BACT|nr:hypothetical protein [Coraliomargarita sinensis]PXA02861.1 hypothetical protein DDZ13_14925 [Coraliomargarita sinensis]